jgi:hypothetical protein
VETDDFFAGINLLVVEEWSFLAAIGRHKEKNEKLMASWFMYIMMPMERRMKMRECKKRQVCNTSARGSQEKFSARKVKKSLFSDAQEIKR